MASFKLQRRGAIVPMFAVILPVLMIFCAMAINLSYVQLSNTQMQVAVDVAVHAGGRRLGTPILNQDGTVQSLAEAKTDVIDFAGEIAAMNSVAGNPADIPESAMEFGRSSRTVKDNGKFASYEFHSVNDDQIPSSFRIISNNLRLRHIFGPFTSSNGFRPSDTFTVNAASVSTQVDRDVVLVLDRSGSMIHFEDRDLLFDTLLDLSEESYTVPGPSITEFRVVFRRLINGVWSNLFYSRVYPNYLTQAEFDATVTGSSTLEYLLWEPSARERPGEDETFDKITQIEYDDANQGFARSWYTSNVIYWLERTENPQHTLGDDPATWTDGLTIDQQRAQLQGHMAVYAHDHRYRYRLNDDTINGSRNIENRRAPTYSRWYHLERGANVFLNVLGGGIDPNGTPRDGTVQKEQIAILPFNTEPDGENDRDDFNPEFDYGLQNDGFPEEFVNNSNEQGYAEPYAGSSLSLRDILGTICPYGGTAIGDSLRDAVFTIRTPTTGDSSARARPFAAKTIVVLTDGQNTVGSNPVTVAREEIANDDVLVHTITFTPGVTDEGKVAMQEVATFGKGRYYHTDSGEELARIFEEIANNLPTILTQ